MRWDDPQIWIIAHRGASATAPEHTEAAIRAAVAESSDFIEMDVQLSSDRRLIVFHDARLDRTTTGRGLVCRTPFDRLRALDAGAWFNRRFAGERILLAAEAVRMIPPRVGINLELKSSADTDALITRVRRLLRETAAGSRAILSSFEPDLVRRVHGLRVRRALICSRHADRSLREAESMGCDAWHPSHRVVTAARVRRAHAAGLRVHVWTVDDPRRARALIRLGVNGLFTNCPGRLRAALAHG